MRNFLGYRTLYACVLLMMLSTLVLILASLFPGTLGLRWILDVIGNLPILIAMMFVLGMMLLLLAHARSVTLSHLMVVRNNMDAILLTRVHVGTLTANPAACQLFGYSEHEIIEGGRDLLIDPDDPEAQSLLHERDNNGSVRGELWIRHKNGQRIRVELSCVIFDYKGEQRSAMIFRDVSKLSQNAYERRIARAAFDDASQFVCVFDRDWRMLWFNLATELISGYDRSELIGHPAPVRRRLEQEEPEKLDEIEQALTTLGHWHGEVYTRRKNGELYPIFGSLTRIESPVPEQPHYVATFSDVSAIREYERKLRDVLKYDPITGLPNRILFEESVQQALGAADPETDILCVLLVSIDQFADINQSLGHSVGDQILRNAGQWLTEHAGPDAHLSRLTSDTFAIMLANLEQEEEAVLIASTFVDAFYAGEDGLDEHIHLTASAGLACYPANGNTVSTLLRHAEIALGVAKQAGGNTFQLFEIGAERETKQFIALAADIHKALDQDEFEAHFQPIIETRSRKIVSMETLARWPRGDAPPIGPQQFIAVAERSGQIEMLSEHMLRQACRHILMLEKAGFAELSVAVNLSARQFRNPRLAEHLTNMVSEEGLSPQRIVLEITESLLMDNTADKRSTLATLQGNGFRVYMDDFGTGYSSLGYLKNFDLDGIKMDQSFIRNLPEHSKDAALVRTILAIGMEFGLPVVAEGVETQAQAQFLQDHGCQHLQGFAIGKPMSSQDFLAYLHEFSHDHVSFDPA
ncbi:bifunctional diguanylate cyclase/phosphodiesterase [Oleiagrimonas sp.]|uniref:sensor domain-containing protein n=1 Tax=Oleiagrimonas sp. TaxID=2010330 RepID=UPI00260CD56D|nr:bifunctional diguanylate cyclase/phosphodiesterase [Oleiagrimonas sp.]MDA3912562.1 EAL domain-containing protein [Oleiagrimonas sp.]